MATAAIMATGTELQIGDGGDPEQFDTIAEVRTLQISGTSVERIDVTNHGSTGGYREFLSGLKDPGEVTFTINYVPTEGTHDAQTGLLAELSGGTTRNYKVVWPDISNTTWSFAALVTGFTPSAPADGALTADVTLKISGAPTLA